MKPMVLTLDRKALDNIGHLTNIHALDWSKLTTDKFHFLNRGVVDNKEGYEDILIGQRFAQILPYIVVKNPETNEILTYSRNGAETRLHGSRSIGIGGHIDIDDIKFNEEGFDPIKTIELSMLREIKEEAGITELDVEALGGIQKIIDRVIIDFSNEVGSVHLGFLGVIETADINPEEELFDHRWVSIDELKQTIDEYESWSRMIINLF